MHNQIKSQPQLKATILLDYTRGTREDQNGESSKSLLTPLLNEQRDAAVDRVSINFFLSPDFSNIFLKNALLNRQKYNEIVSLQHIKVYLFDDGFIISGANLNEQYFTNRQDRYIYVRNCPQLADYLERLIQAIGSISAHLNSDGTFSFELDPLDEQNKQKIQFKLREQIEQLNRSYLKAEAKGAAKLAGKGKTSDGKTADGKPGDSKADNKTDNRAETMIYPLLQMKKFEINSDETFTKFVFNSLSDSCRLFLASGYFNLTQDYQQCIFKTASDQSGCSIELVMASEQVNSFYKAKGPIQHIPSVYTQLSKNFLEELNSRLLKNVRLLSYFRSNWTFHAKGLWLRPADTSDYFLSLCGSPNFGYRSVYRDLELQMAILTKDENLVKQFMDEYENIRTYSTCISTPDQLPFVSYWIRIVTGFVKSFF